MRFIASFWRLYNNTLKFQKLFILFVAAFYPDNSVFCEKMRMSLGTMELISNKSASFFLKHSLIRKANKDRNTKGKM